MLNTNPNTPYANLKPDSILDAVESVGFRCNGSLFPLNSYENRVYQIGIEEADPVIAKFYRPLRWSNEAILEEHQFAAELSAHEIPVVAPLVMKNKTLHDYKGFRFALFVRRGGRALELDSLEQLEWMGRFIGRLHATGACRSFHHRHTLTVDYFGFAPCHFLLENNFIPDYLKQPFGEAIETALNRIKIIFQQTGEIKQIRLHGDCHAGNVLWRDSGPHIVDLDDCMMGPAIQDLWMLLSGNEMQMQAQLERILWGYCEFHDFNYRELHLIEALRTLRMLHYSAWLAKRWEDPAFPLNFPWFNTAHYWQEQLNNLNEQIQKLPLALS
ncbi:MAG TPA: serine/threonine protein kinase [Gammaproteobacteria bacterium]|nr:serine/threonine protein kinase [Gammaproteobacteria bacterium]